jgi:hypothetical protein
VNVERAEDVLMHKRLLHLAHDPANRPQIEIRLVQVTTPLQCSVLHAINSNLCSFHFLALLYGAAYEARIQTRTLTRRHR